MAPHDKHMMDNRLTPGLFGQRHTSRDYTKASSWGKNMFNSSFPASLVAYMHSNGVKPVYLKIDADNKLIHSYISGKELYGIDPLSDDAYYNFEAGFSAFEKYYTRDREKIDLVMVNRTTNQSLIGLEVKLTALPDNTTLKKSEEEYSCEIVVRPPTICFLACSICEQFKSDERKNQLRRLLNTVPKIAHWEEVREVAPYYSKIEAAIKDVAAMMYDRQTPLVIQPVWKMKDKALATDCLDIFVWSNIALLHLCYAGENVKPLEISRFQRAVIWTYLMLKDYVDYDTFDYVRIIKDHSYQNANDKAFSIPGTSSYRFLKSDELLHPRIKKQEIKNIILGGGHIMLYPETFNDDFINNIYECFQKQ